MNTPVVLKPRLTEKSYAVSQERNTYVFDVPTSANKHDVARAVASQYGVKVVGVRLANSAGKKVRSIRRGGRSIKRYERPGVRKAYVTLDSKDKLPLFAGTDETKNKGKES